MQIYKKPTFPFLSLSPLSVRVKRSEVLSDDVTVIVEIKECEGTGFSIRQVSIGFHNLPLFMGEKKKWCPRNPYASGIFYPICPACKAWHSVIQPYWLSVFGHYTFSCIYWQIGHKIAANCATRKFQQCNLNPRSLITKQRSLFYLNMRIINVIRQQS